VDSGWEVLVSDCLVRLYVGVERRERWKASAYITPCIMRTVNERQSRDGSCREEPVHYIEIARDRSSLSRRERYCEEAGVNGYLLQRTLRIMARLRGLAPGCQRVGVVVRPVLALVASFTQILATSTTTTPIKTPRLAYQSTTCKTGSWGRF
jgi:hypothetical protein